QPDLPGAMVGAVRSAFAVDGVALLQPVGGRLEVVASAGSPMSPEELARIRSEAHVPVPLSTGASHDVVQTLALASSRRPIGMLVLRNAPDTRAVREALPILANHLAVALERAELHARIHRAELLEEVDRLRQALVGAVSHDLRSPLATIKVASSTLAASSGVLSDSELKELHQLIDLQTDRLNRLVTNLLDMTRIQAGSLEVRRTPTQVTDLVAEAVAGLRAELGDRRVTVVAPDTTPLVDADPLLVGQVLANLLDNAQRHGPPGTAITVEIAPAPGPRVVVSVSDQGPGVPAAERRAIFETFVRFDTGGRSGLGLAIAKAFIEAHGDRIWVEDAPGGGARFVFTLPRAPTSERVAR
ncbi:MAG TPA: ATP-binding protein, partial [Acidimicrobiales bacterium]|nr:ATP-binding protein [Acidimicrobiales bacterium]